MKIIATGLLLLSCVSASYAASSVARNVSWLVMPYDKQGSQSVDMAIPENPKGLFVWVHGGGWDSGDKGDERPHLEALYRKGVGVISMNYRLGREGVFPAAIQDVQSVLNAVEAGGCETCGQPGSWSKAKKAASQGLMVGGLGVGGYLASYAVGDRLTALPTTAVKCVSVVSALWDFRSLNGYPVNTVRDIDAFLSHNQSPAARAKASPMHNVETGVWQNLDRAKWYFHYSEKDSIIPFDKNASIPEKLYAKGIHAFRTISLSVADGKHALDKWDIDRAIVKPAEHCFGMTN